MISALRSGHPGPPVLVLQSASGGQMPEQSSICYPITVGAWYFREFEVCAALDASVPEVLDDLVQQGILDEDEVDCVLVTDGDRCLYRDKHFKITRIGHSRCCPPAAKASLVSKG